MTRVQGTSAAVETKFLSKPIIAEPGTACTESYLVACSFDTELEAKNYATYLRTRFARFLVSLRKSIQDAPKHVYAFIPDLPVDQEWTTPPLPSLALHHVYSISPVLRSSAHDDSRLQSAVQAQRS
jgi:site-specific DNA-methyltransferase (adenine-specific)